MFLFFKPEVVEPPKKENKLVQFAVPLSFIGLAIFLSKKK